MHARLAVLEKRDAWLPRLSYWLRSGEGKGETGGGQWTGERERERVSRERNSRDPTDRRLPALN